MHGYRVVVLALAWCVATGGPMSGEPRHNAQTPSATADHVAWVADALRRMQTIKPGMTRGELLAVFRPQSGISSRQNRSYQYPGCPYFHVDVVFQAMGSATTGESIEDVITKISPPYLGWSTVN